MSEFKPMKTLSEVMNKLRERGIHSEFRMNEKGEMVLDQGTETFEPTDLIIVRSYRFEGDSNPDDNAVLYVAQEKGGRRGILIDSYGAESNYPGEEFDNFIREICTEEDESLNFDAL